MKQAYPIIALAVLLAGGFFFFSNFKVSTDQPGGLQIQPRDPLAGPGPTSPLGGLLSGANPTNPIRPPVQPANVPVSSPGRPTGLGGDFIRMASFNIQVFGESKLAKREVVQVLAEVVRNFDVVAIQEIRAQSQSILPTFLQYVNAGGDRYDYVISERLGRTDSKEQYAFVFNTDTIEVDRRSAYVVHDRDDLIHREPFVAGFRCRRAEPHLAFTFTLINIHTDPDRQDLQRELAVLDDVMNAVRLDGRGEDDIILLGDFNTSYNKMGDLNGVPNLTFTITGNLATNTKGNAQYDNIVFDRLATQEFLGRGGVFDFLREYNLSQAQADQVSDHIPVWAEFSVYEGGVPGRVAARPAPRHDSPPYAGQRW